MIFLAIFSFIITYYILLYYLLLVVVALYKKIKNL